MLLLPNLIIAGVHKAGTTSLYTYLAKHPQICSSFKKEIGFFTPLVSNRAIPALEEYAKYFCHCGSEKLRMEASPSYLYGKEVIAEAIRKTIPEVKIIVILRDPAERLVSFFNRAVSKFALPESMSFQDYLSTSERKMGSSDQDVYARGIREGFYIDYIRPWQRIFDQELKIVFFDDLQQNTPAMMKDVCAWLGLTTTGFESQVFSIENKTRQYRYKNLHRRIKDAYIRNEAYWRRHHKLKQVLRGAYNLFNAEKHSKSQSIDDADISRLRALYAPYNKELRILLEANNYASLPQWLNDKTSA